MKKILLFGAALMMAAVSMAQTPTVSASSVTFKYCQTTYGSAERQVGKDKFPLTWNGVTFTTYTTEVITLQNARGCDSILTLTVAPLEGAVLYPFSVASGKQVYFAKGNLQYCAAPASGPTTHTTRDGSNTKGRWRIAEHAWDHIGTGGSYSTVPLSTGSGTSANNSRSSTYNGWIDMFKYGTSGYAGLMPYTNSYYSDRSDVPDTNIGKNISQTNVDWGWYNAISNGGNKTGVWFMLTENEWYYLMMQRPNYQYRRATGTVNGIQGTFILPDSWSTPSGLTFNANSSNNSYTAEQWALMEQRGAVFLPCTGYTYNGQNYVWGDYNSSNSCYYWTSTYYSNNYYWRRDDLTGGQLSGKGSGSNLQYGNSYYQAAVRLVRYSE